MKHISPSFPMTAWVISNFFISSSGTIAYPSVDAKTLCVSCALLRYPIKKSFLSWDSFMLSRTSTTACNYMSKCVSWLHISTCGRRLEQSLPWLAITHNQCCTCSVATWQLAERSAPPPNTHSSGLAQLSRLKLSAVPKCTHFTIITKSVQCLIMDGVCHVLGNETR